MPLRIIEDTMLNGMTFWAPCISSAMFINRLEYIESSGSAEYTHQCDQRRQHLVNVSLNVRTTERFKDKPTEEADHSGVESNEK